MGITVDRGPPPLERKTEVEGGEEKKLEGRKIGHGKNQT